MKLPVFLNVIVAFALTVITASGQGNCKVLLKGIEDSYTGSCRNGLADGKGEAFGTDQYKGEFKKGLPDGTGTYIWQTGEKYEGQRKKGMRNGEGKYIFKSDGKDTTLAGIWKADKYIGERAMTPYIISFRKSITRVSCVKGGDTPHYVVYKFSRPGGSLDDINNLLMQGSSGTETNSNNFLGFEQVTFPFDGKIVFEAPNVLHTVNANYELRFTINQPGAWTVTIYY